MKAPPKDQKKDDLQELATLQEKGIHILDALAATGLRSVRYLKEIPNVRCVTINDLVSVNLALCNLSSYSMHRVL